MLDTYKLKGLRQKLVDLLREKGIRNEAVLEALGKVPRHAFVESAFSEASYEDRAMPIGDGQTISQPFTVAYQTACLQVRKGMKVLEIGTGSGYQAAILCEMGARLFSIERLRSLHIRAKDILADLGHKPRLKWGDGSQGWEAFAPYDRILVTAASPVVPEVLKRQLAEGGRLVIPVGNLQVQEMILVERIDSREYKLTTLDKFQFVPMIGKNGFAE